MSIIFFVASVICMLVCLYLIEVVIEHGSDFCGLLLGMGALIFLGIACELLRNVIENN